MTFFELGIPFELFEGDSDECDAYRDVGDCGVCGERGHLFAFPAAEGAETVACYKCLRSGRVTYPKKTEPGLTPEQIAELWRTPDHDGLDTWPTCCKRPMVFLGTTDDQLLPTGPDAIMMGDFGGHGEGWTYCLYQCPACSTISAQGHK